MKVVILYGTARHGTTRRLTELFLDALPHREVTEFCFPRDMDAVCLGCARCVMETEAVCPHCALMDPIRSALLAADLIVVSSPVYVMGMTAGLKGLFEHLAHLWMVHRPDSRMGAKVAVVIATAAGPATGGTLKALKQQLAHWGVPKVYKWGEMVAGGWEYMKPAQQEKLTRRAATLAQKAAAQVGHVSGPSLGIRAFYGAMKFFMRLGGGDAA